jgi:hypothetical protein
MPRRNTSSPTGDFHDQTLPCHEAQSLKSVDVNKWPWKEQAASCQAGTLIRRPAISMLRRVADLRLEASFSYGQWRTMLAQSIR